jgi:hypothetical protein
MYKTVETTCFKTVFYVSAFGFVGCSWFFWVFMAMWLCDNCDSCSNESRVMKSHRLLDREFRLQDCQSHAGAWQGEGVLKVQLERGQRVVFHRH